jgi:hypothetical protein
MTDVIKCNGNVQQAFNEGNVPDSWESLLQNSEVISVEDNKPKEYKLK